MQVVFDLDAVERKGLQFGEGCIASLADPAPGLFIVIQRSFDSYDKMRQKILEANDNEYQLMESSPAVGTQVYYNENSRLIRRYYLRDIESFSTQRDFILKLRMKKKNDGVMSRLSNAVRAKEEVKLSFTMNANRRVIENILLTAGVPHIHHTDNY